VAETVRPGGTVSEVVRMSSRGRFPVAVVASVAAVLAGLVAPLPGPDPNHIIDRIDENQAISRVAACPGGLPYGPDGLLHVVVAQDDVHLYPRQHVHLICARAAGEHYPPLPAVPLDLGHVHPDDAYAVE